MSRRKVVRIIFILTSLFVGLVLVVQLIVKTKVVRNLEESIPKHIHLDYDVLSVNVLLGSIEVKGIRLEIYNQDTLLRHTTMNMEALNLKGLGYINLLFKNKISIGNLELLRPDIRYTPNNYIPHKNIGKKEGEALKMTIADFNIVEGEYVQMQQNTDSVKLNVSSFDLNLNQLEISSESLKNKIPFTYKDYIIRSKNLFMDLSPYEVLNIAEVTMVQNELSLSNLSLTSKYNRKELSRLVKKERDHIDLKIPEALFSNLEFGFNGARFFLYMSHATLNDPSLKMYRDKLVYDDLERKKLYSRMLRELPLDLEVPELKVKGGYISYTEFVTEGVRPGEIVFTDLDAELKQISNTNKRGDGTKIMISALLMGEAPLKLNWSFDPQLENDAFLVAGEVRDFKSESINPFLKSNLRSEAKGNVKELFFTFSGDAVSATGDIKMKYQDFGFVVLKKNRGGVNKLLTTLGNLFINDGSHADSNGYRYGTIYAERDVSKSFFNYLWLNVKEGVLSTLTGNGKQN